MDNKFLAVVAVALGAISAAGVGGYLAVREGARTEPVVEAARAAQPSADAPTAPEAVTETEALLSAAPEAPPAPAPAAPASAAASPRTAARPAPLRQATAPRVERRAPVERPTQVASATRTAPAPVERTRERVETPAPTARTTNDVSAAAESADSPALRPAAEPYVPAPPPAPVFEELVVPADAVVGLQVDSTITTERARVEDPVSARITRDVRVGGRVAIPAGSRVQGTVTLVERGGKIKDRARLGVRFHTLVLADGTRASLATETLYREGESVGRGSAAKIGGGAVGGAIIGAILGGGKGAAIGAATGAGGGTAAAMAGDRKPATLPAGSSVTVRLNAPVTVTVEKSPDRDPGDR